MAHPCKNFICTMQLTCLNEFKRFPVQIATKWLYWIHICTDSHFFNPSNSQYNTDIIWDPHLHRQSFFNGSNSQYNAGIMISVFVQTVLNPLNSHYNVDII